jgi:hypothetical protein
MTTGGKGPRLTRRNVIASLPKAAGKPSLSQKTKRKPAKEEKEDHPRPVPYGTKETRRLSTGGKGPRLTKKALLELEKGMDE